jgi:hypothetical protein
MERPIRYSERKRAEQSNPDSAAALSQAGAPLSWTSERADMLFVCERDALCQAAAR